MKTKELKNEINQMLDGNIGIMLYAVLKTDEEKNLLRGSFEIKTYDLKSVKDLYKLTPLINSFFEAVLVNDENIEDKNNRLALLLKLRSSFDTFADFTKFKKV